MERFVFIYENAYFRNRENVFLESRAVSEKYTRIQLYGGGGGGEEACDPQAFRANLLSVLYSSVLIEVWVIRSTIIVPRLHL